MITHSLPAAQLLERDVKWNRLAYGYFRLAQIKFVFDWLRSQSGTRQIPDAVNNLRNDFSIWGSSQSVKPAVQDLYRIFAKPVYAPTVTDWRHLHINRFIPRPLKPADQPRDVSHEVTTFLNNLFFDGEGSYMLGVDCIAYSFKAEYLVTEGMLKMSETLQLPDERCKNRHRLFLHCTDVLMVEVPHVEPSQHAGRTVREAVKRSLAEN